MDDPVRPSQMVVVQTQRRKRRRPQPHFRSPRPLAATPARAIERRSGRHRRHGDAQGTGPALPFRGSALPTICSGICWASRCARARAIGATTPPSSCAAICFAVVGAAAVFVGSRRDRGHDALAEPPHRTRARCHGPGTRSRAAGLRVSGRRVLASGSVQCPGPRSHRQGSAGSGRRQDHRQREPAAGSARAASREHRPCLPAARTERTCHTAVRTGRGHPPRGAAARQSHSRRGAGQSGPGLDRCRPSGQCRSLSCSKRVALAQSGDSPPSAETADILVQVRALRAERQERPGTRHEAVHSTRSLSIATFPAISICRSPPR